MACDSLLVVTEIRQALAEAKSLDDVLAIREKAEAMRRLLKLKDESLAAQNDMAEVTVRAEVMLGEWWDKCDKAKPGRKNRSHPVTDSVPTLAALGIQKMDAHRWQTMAKAKRRIAALLKQANDAGKEFTRAMVYREGRRILKGDDTPQIKDAQAMVGALRRQVFRMFDDHAELRSVLPRVLREIADELTGFMESDDGSGRGNRQDSASAA